MSQQPVEAPLPPIPDLERTSLRETSTLTHESVPSTISLPTNPAHPESSLRNRKGGWNNLMRFLVPRPSLRVFFILIAIAGVSFCPAVFSDYTSANSNTIDLATPGVALDGVFLPNDGMILEGHIVSFDWLNPSKVSVDWFVGGYGKYDLATRDGVPSPASSGNITVDIYFNGSSGPVFSYDPSRIPAVPDPYPYPGSLISFTMEHNIETSSLYLAPDDRHNFSVFVFAIERATNISVPITVDFYISDTGEFTTVAGITSDITVPYGFLHDAGDRPTTVESQVIDCWVARSVSARALTYSMFAINWMLVICSIITTSVTFNRQGGEGDVGISLLPVTIILTIPVIRGLYVGSPPFGIHLDMVGFFPQMLIVASCTVVILSSYAVKSIRGKDASAEEKAGV